MENRSWGAISSVKYLSQPHEVLGLSLKRYMKIQAQAERVDSGKFLNL